ncbi:MAG TPA: hypothetical protein VHM26_00960, partial [Chitinophagaceae bacterium]|nr:hypothetical protein [Chitinophagaceae bacterium]
MIRLPLLLFLLLPLLAVAQTKPGLSKAYLDLVRKDSSQQTTGTSRDTTNSIRNSYYLNKTMYDGRSPIGKIKIDDKRLTIKPARLKGLFISSTFTSTAELRSINRQPSLQKEYVQGRSQGGQLIWQGPETGELFSYGPSLQTLEFDNSNYPYDVNGRLVAVGTGSGKKAIAYNNDVLRTASMLSQSLNMQARYRVNNIAKVIATLKLGDKQERLLIKDNKNSSRNLGTSLEFPLKPVGIKIAYTLQKDRYTHSNRNGFLNRIYQQSLLTPTSFDNAQGMKIGNMQRSYSPNADNPYFLLNTDANSFEQSHQTASLSLEKKIGRKLKVKLQQSIEDLDQRSNETYQPGTASFPTGIAVYRSKDDKNYQAKANAHYTLGKFISSSVRSTIEATYLYGDNNSVISYLPGQQYKYQRSYHDAIVNWLNTINSGRVESGLQLTNKMYASNTVTKNDFFIPGVTAYGKIHTPFNLDRTSIKFNAAFNKFNSELPIDRSFAFANLLQYTPAQSLQYFPVSEAATFNGLSPIRHTEWSARMEFEYTYKLYFSIEYFNRKIVDDVFPVYRGGSLVLDNIATHRNRGYEINLTIDSRSWQRKVSAYTNISLSRFQSKVLDVKDGYDNTPMAGFSNIHKSIVKGQQLGVITGTRYKRDQSDKIMIGSDGFPMTDPTPAVIGNPNPDLIMKLANNITWKNFSLNFDIEWKKGGDIWNGTQAMLDYYGRSATTGDQRNITNYIFDGVLENGHTNTIPVNFYD